MNAPVFISDRCTNIFVMGLHLWLTNVVFEFKQNCHNTTQNGIKYYFKDLQILKADTRF